MSLAVLAGALTGVADAVGVADGPEVAGGVLVARGGRVVSAAVAPSDEEVEDKADETDVGAFAGRAVLRVEELARRDIGMLELTVDFKFAVKAGPGRAQVEGTIAEEALADGAARGSTGRALITVAVFVVDGPGFGGSDMCPAIVVLGAAASREGGEADSRFEEAEAEAVFEGAGR